MTSGQLRRRLRQLRENLSNFFKLRPIPYSIDWIREQYSRYWEEEGEREREEEGK